MTTGELEDVSLAYPGAGQAAVDRLSAVIPAGKLTVLLGPSGCGKTTVMKMIAGLLAPDQGDIRIGGASVLGLPAERRGAAMVFQDHLLFDHMTVADNISFGPRMAGQSRAGLKGAVETMLDDLRLGGLGARMPAALSGGQKQRVALARALMAGPQVLLLDEPLSSLDADLRGDMRALIRRLQRDRGVTTLLVTHDQEEAAVMADHMALMLEGRLAQVGAPEDFYARPAHRAVADFFGARNFIAGSAMGARFGTALGALAVEAPLGQAQCLTIRPEAVALGPGPNPVDARLIERQFLGTQVALRFEAAGQSLYAQVPPSAANGLETGASVTLHLPPAALWPLAKA